MKFINQDIEQDTNEDVNQNISTGANNTKKEEVNENNISVVTPEENGANSEKEELEFNKNKREDFEKLMDESSTDKDIYWDKNNPFVKLLLLILAVIIVLGSIYYIFSYLNK